MNYHGIEIAEDKLAEFCQEWKVTELSLFSSILREDFLANRMVHNAVEQNLEKKGGGPNW